MYHLKPVKPHTSGSFGPLLGSSLRPTAQKSRIVVSAHNKNPTEDTRAPTERLTQQLERLFQSNAADSSLASSTFTNERTRLVLEAQLQQTRAAANEIASLAFVSQDTEEASEPATEPTPSFGGIQLPAAVSQLLGRIPPRVRGLLMLNGLVLLVATNWVVVKQEGAAFDPFLFAALRFGVAALAFSPFLIKAVKEPKLLKAGAELGVWSAVGYLAQAEGLMTTDASRASFLSTFTVLVVPFLAGMNGRGVSKLTWASAAAALVGVSLLEQSGSPPSIGDAWSILSAIGFGIQMYRTEHWSRIVGKDSTLRLMSIVLAVIALFAGVAAAGSHTADVVHMFNQPQVVLTKIFCCDTIPWKQVFYTGLLTTDVALLLEIVALRDVSSVEASILYTLEPVLGAGFAFMMLGERFGPTGWAGASLILVSCILTQIYGSPDEGAVIDVDSKSD